MSGIDEVRERMAQGWTIHEATMGKGWQLRYPNTARWKGGGAYGWGDDVCHITLSIGSGYKKQGCGYTSYIVADETFVGPEEDVHQLRDGVIERWLQKYGEEGFAKYERGWQGEACWKSKYPHIAGWNGRDKRFCLQITFDLIANKSTVKAWHYCRSQNRETVLFEETLYGRSEEEALRRLDDGIGQWLKNHPDAYLPTAEEDESGDAA